jgi:hypothetical protein
MHNQFWRNNMTEESSPMPSNPAVDQCYGVWQRVYKAEIAKGVYHIIAGQTAGKAYRRALPPLSGQENIRDFIACVAYGMLIEAIDEKTGPKLLYAAQVAHTMLPKQPSQPKVAAA